ncbi:MAG TPA: hypothetical protein PLY93_09690, partial [Turneriella sp.]|nr:hypothetical protein [Turneriella sp.]
MRFAGRWWIVIPAALWAFLFTACIQTTELLQPVNSKPITTAAQGTLTLQLNLTATEHKNQVFSVLVFQMGTLKAVLTDDGSATTDGAGAASVAVKAVDTNNCATATNALLDNGEYNYYFVINYNTLARTAVNTGATGNGCGASGFIDSTAGGT